MRSLDDIQRELRVKNTARMTVILTDFLIETQRVNTDLFIDNYIAGFIDEVTAYNFMAWARNKREQRRIARLQAEREATQRHKLALAIRRGSQHADPKLQMTALGIWG